MDFVVSKVAMSICALLVAAVLGNIYGDGAFRDVRGELEGVAMDLIAVASAPLDARTECTASWEVPYLSAGEEVSVVVSAESIRVFTSSVVVMIATPFAMHTWSWDGSPLNDSLVAELDGRAPKTTASSRGTITIAATEITVGNEPELMVFAHPDG